MKIVVFLLFAITVTFSHAQKESIIKSNNWVVLNKTYRPVEFDSIIIDFSLDIEFNYNEVKNALKNEKFSDSIGVVMYDSLDLSSFVVIDKYRTITGDFFELYFYVQDQFRGFLQCDSVGKLLDKGVAVSFFATSKGLVLDNYFEQDVAAKRIKMIQLIVANDKRKYSEQNIIGSESNGLEFNCLKNYKENTIFSKAHGVNYQKHITEELVQKRIKGDLGTSLNLLNFE